MTTNIGETTGVAKKTSEEVDNAHEISVGSEKDRDNCAVKLNPLNDGLAQACDAVLMLNEQTEKIRGILDLI